ncbi:hypothetical protein SNE40_007253 [Patella caerulea]|uniref:TIR domain-containing protein n=1 Tax=Patella caerulea TaxID=87958 RepID=A0AAN8K5K5_PATCE
MAQLTLSLFMVLVITQTISQNSPQRVYDVLWPNGTTIKFSYDFKKESECIYDSVRDNLICMRNYGYGDITSRWSYNQDEFKYLSVKCMEQAVFTNHKHACLCKNGALAANPGQNKQRDGFTYCQIGHIYSGLFDKLINVELIDLSNNLITGFPMTIFSKLKSLRFLNLSNNPLRRITTGLLCGLKNLKILVLQKLSLELFPWNIFSCNSDSTLNVQVIDLSNSHISEIPDQSFRNIPRLIFLNLTNNLLKSLPPTPFIEATSLLYLDLSENFISELNDDFCAGLQSLQNLYLKGNSFQITDITPLAKCSQLRFIDLSKNRIDDLTTHTEAHPSVTFLNLSDNDLEVISQSLFSYRYPSLRFLDISNNDIKAIHAHAFSGLENLTHLNLSWNRIKIKSNEFYGNLNDLTNIETLDLGNNMLTNLDDYVFGNLTKLEHLHLDNNHISNITSDAFARLRSLVSLNLENNLIYHFNDSVFENLTSLRMLNLSRNNIDTIRYCEFPLSLEKLDISFNRIVDFPERLFYVKQLILTSNRITHIPSGSFSKMHSLEVLSLKYNRITSLANFMFSGLDNLNLLDISNNFIDDIDSSDAFKGLDSLRILDLRDNKINRLDGLFRKSSLNSLAELRLSNNPIGLLTHALNPDGQKKMLQKFYCRNCKITHTSSDVFANMTHLHTVDLSKNRITSFAPFIGNDETVFNLLENPTVCTCQMKWLKEKNLNNYRVQACIVYPKIGEMAIKRVPKELFLCTVSNCTERCRCYSREEDSTPETIICSHDKLKTVPSRLPTSVKVVYLDGNNFWNAGHIQIIADSEIDAEEIYLNSSRIAGISSNIFSNMPLLKLIDLSRNYIPGLPADVFKNLKFLKEVHLKNNQIKYIEPGLFRGLGNLQIIDIRSNEIEHLLSDTLSELSDISEFRWIHLSNNPWKCDCANKQFREWIISHRSRIYDRKRLYCGHTEIIRQNPEMFGCSNAVFLIIGVSVAGSCFILFVITLGFFIFCFRRNLIALGYSRLKIARFHSSKTFAIPRPYLYDMVIIYDEMDLKCKWWVNKTLFPRLTQKNWRFKVYIANVENCSDDDFLYEVKHKIHQSQSTLFLISKNFTRSYICMSSFRYANAESTSLGHKILIMEWGEFTKEVLESGIKEYIKRRDYLKVTERFVIDKLICLMPTPYSEKCNQVVSRNNDHHRVSVSSSLNNLILNTSFDSVQSQ